MTDKSELEAFAIEHVQKDWEPEASSLREQGIALRDKQREADIKAGALKVIEWATQYCETVQGNVMHCYRGDVATANELLIELKKRCGV